MIFRSPPLTRQRLRMQQAAPVQHLQNDGNEQPQNIENRPINTANTGVAENSLNDGEILAHTMNSDQILHAVLNIEPANRQSGHGEDAENLANQQNLTQQLGGLRMRFRRLPNMGENSERELWQAGNGNNNAPAPKRSQYSSKS
ncbi:hypothetical protein niasHT_019104 [Heterodera trifolii]|uniref:Uncharacterized protein n=1 Tax=Heterodera trifolii TaxID=157864 RepID=A0ABD2LB05_9BILA